MQYRSEFQLNFLLNLRSFILDVFFRFVVLFSVFECLVRSLTFDVCVCVCVFMAVVMHDAKRVIVCQI